MGRKRQITNRTKAIGYVRVSSKQQRDEGSSLTDQRDEIIRHCVISNLELIDIYEDGGISGGKDESGRPGLAAALNAVRDERASVLVVKHVDRLSRDSDLAGYIKVALKRIGGTLQIIDGVEDDPIRAAVDKLAAELERIRGSQRMKFSHRMRRERGLWTGGAPFGYRVVDGKLAAIDAEQPVIAKIATLRGAGVTIREIATALNTEGLRTRAGGKWSPSSVHQVVRRLSTALPIAQAR